MARKKTGRRKSRKKQSRAKLVWLTLAAVLSVFAAYCVFQAVYVQDIYNLHPEQTESDCPTEIGNLHVTTHYLPVGYQGRTGTERKIRWIAIHETDNTEPNATAKSHDDYLHTYAKDHPLSWHYTVDENEVYHHIPDKETAFHAGDNIRKRGGNRNAIGIELCVNEGSDFNQTMHNAAVLVAYLLDKYDLTIDDVKQHRDFSGKICPSTLITENRWDEFLTMVEQALYDRRTELVTSE